MIENLAAPVTGQAPSPTTPSQAPAGSSAISLQPPVSSPAQADWIGALNESDRGYIQNKGFKTPGDLAESYRNLEKLRGVPQERLLTLPDNWDDTEQTGKLYAKLGRPEKPEGYGFKVKDGEDATFTKWAEKEFFDAGLNSAQAKKLADGWNGLFEQSKASAMAERVSETEKQAANLKKEWGMAYGQNERIAKLSAAKLGVDTPTVDKIEEALGYEATMKLFHKFGAGMGEGNFVGSSGNASDSFGNLSPEAASSKIEQLMADHVWVKKYQSGDVGARNQMKELQIMKAFKG